MSRTPCVLHGQSGTFLRLVLLHFENGDLRCDDHSLIPADLFQERRVQVLSRPDQRDLPQEKEKLTGVLVQDAKNVPPGSNNEVKMLNGAGHACSFLRSPFEKRFWWIL